MLRALKPTLLILALTLTLGLFRAQLAVALVPQAPEGVVAAASNVPGGANFNGKCDQGNIDKTNCGIIAYLITGINILSGLVGVVVVVMIAVAGIQYSMSRDNPQATSAAKERIRNAIIALLLYMFMWAFLQYIIPGGVL